MLYCKYRRRKNALAQVGMEPTTSWTQGMQSTTASQDSTFEFGLLRIVFSSTLNSQLAFLSSLSMVA